MIFSKHITQEELNASIEQVDLLVLAWIHNEMIIASKVRIPQDKENQVIGTLIDTSISKLITCSIPQLVVAADDFTRLLTPREIYSSQAAARFTSLLVTVEQAIPAHIKTHFRSTFTTAILEVLHMNENANVSKKIIKHNVYTRWPGMWLVPFIQRHGMQILSAEQKSEKRR